MAGLTRPPISPTRIVARTLDGRFKPVRVEFQAFHFSNTSSQLGSFFSIRAIFHARFPTDVNEAAGHAAMLEGWVAGSSPAMVSWVGMVANHLELVCRLYFSKNCPSLPTRQASALLPAALFFDPVVSRIDHRQLVGGEADELLGHAAGDQLVGVVFAHQHAVGRLDLVVGRVEGDAHDDIGIALVGPDMGGADAAVGVLREAEDIGDAL